MVFVHLSKQVYAPGDEVKIAIVSRPSDEIQLLSVRGLGYTRLPANITKEILSKDKYALKDKPLGPSLPSDSILLWYSPNFPVHFENSSEGLVKMFIPYFVPPSIKGGLFEICHFVEVSVFNKGSYEMKVKRIPLTISCSNPAMEISFAPAVGDGYEQFDFNIHPTLQSSTPHGKRASNWELLQIISQSHLQRRKMSSSGIFKSRRNFRISFNNQQATEISVHGQWTHRASVGDLLTIPSGIGGYILPVHFKFTEPDVFVKRIVIRLIRIESLIGRDEQFETQVWTSIPIPVTQYIDDLSRQIPIPGNLCPSFRSEIAVVDYRLDFELRAIDQLVVVLEPVIWSLPLEICPDDQTDNDVLVNAPVLTLGCIPRLGQDVSDIDSNPHSHRATVLLAAEIDSVISNSSINPGYMKFNIFPAPN